mmetsp:Transcript_11779/g.24715  ORF Transcript_11779/g.24715 Transcript_11779/m.24715 type:complete len:209 (-) Transcript_11779:679-1305(-)
MYTPCVARRVALISATNQKGSGRFGVFAIGQAVQVRPSLIRKGHICPASVDLGGVDVRENDLRVRFAGGQNLSERADDHGVPPCSVRGVRVARGAAARHVELVVHRARLVQELPVQRPCHHVERAWVDEHGSAAGCVDRGELREAHVEADADAEPAHLCVHHGPGLALCERIRLLERDLARNVDVKQMGLPMFRQQGPLSIVHTTRIV